MKRVLGVAATAIQEPPLKILKQTNETNIIDIENSPPKDNCLSEVSKSELDQMKTTEVNSLHESSKLLSIQPTTEATNSPVIVATSNQPNNNIDCTTQLDKLSKAANSTATATTTSTNSSVETSKLEKISFENVDFRVCIICRQSLQGRSPLLLGCLHSYCSQCFLQKKYFKMTPIQFNSNEKNNYPEQNCKSLKVDDIPDDAFKSLENLHKFLTKNSESFTRLVATCQICECITRAKVVARNYFVASLCAKPVEKACDSLNTNKEKTLCTNCEEKQPAIKFCKECDEYLCIDCIKAHKRIKLTKEHTLEVVEASSNEVFEENTSEFKYCQIHKKEELKLYCEKCCTLTCRDCQLDMHRNHPYSFVEEAVKTFSKFLEDTRKNLLNKKFFLNQASDSIKIQLRSMMSCRNKANEQILRFHAELHRALSFKCQEYLNTVNNVTESHLEKLNYQGSSTDRLSKVVNHCVKFIDFAMEEQNSLALIRSKNMIDEYMTAVLRQKFPNISNVKSDIAFIPDEEIKSRINSKIGSVVVGQPSFTKLTFSPVATGNHRQPLQHPNPQIPSQKPFVSKSGFTVLHKQTCGVHSKNSKLTSPTSTNFQNNPIISSPRHTHDLVRGAPMSISGTTFNPQPQLMVPHSTSTQFPPNRTIPSRLYKSTSRSNSVNNKQQLQISTVGPSSSFRNSSIQDILLCRDPAQPTTAEMTRNSSELKPFVMTVNNRSKHRSLSNSSQKVSPKQHDQNIANEFSSSKLEQQESETSPTTTSFDQSSFLAQVVACSQESFIHRLLKSSNTSLNDLEKPTACDNYPNSPVERKCNSASSVDSGFISTNKHTENVSKRSPTLSPPQLIDLTDIINIEDDMDTTKQTDKLKITSGDNLVLPKSLSEDNPVVPTTVSKDKPVLTKTLSEDKPALSKTLSEDNLVLQNDDDSVANNEKNSDVEDEKISLRLSSLAEFQRVAVKKEKDSNDDAVSFFVSSIVENCGDELKSNLLNSDDDNADEDVENDVLNIKNISDVEDDEDNVFTKTNLCGDADGKTFNKKDCDNEDWCAVCNNGGKVLCCDFCPRVFHFRCHVPELITAPEGCWRCTFCLDIDKSLENDLKYPKRRRLTGLSLKEQKTCEKLLLDIYCHRQSVLFHHPVSSSVPKYYEVIKNPVDLSRIKKRLQSGHIRHYETEKEFLKDIQLMFTNCFHFNEEDSEIAVIGKKLQAFFVERVNERMPNQVEFVKILMEEQKKFLDENPRISIIKEQNLNSSKPPRKTADRSKPVPYESDFLWEPDKEDLELELEEEEIGEPSDDDEEERDSYDCEDETVFEKKVSSSQRKHSKESVVHIK